MSRVRLLNGLLIAASILTLACSQSGAAPTNVKPLHRVQSADLAVVVLAQDGVVREGADTLWLEFRNVSGDQLVDVGDVTVSATMPMAGMAPMVGAAAVRRTGVPGRYELEAGLPMAGDWRLDVQWDGPAGRGKVTVSTSAQ